MSILTLVEKNEVWRIELSNREQDRRFQLLPSCSSSVTAALIEAIKSGQSATEIESTVGTANPPAAESCAAVRSRDAAC
jgi:hypothetical protein